MNFKSTKLLSMSVFAFLGACSAGGGDGGQSYSFTATVDTVFTDASRLLSQKAEAFRDLYREEGLMGILGNSLKPEENFEAKAVTCNDTVCLDATNVTGKYYGVGLLLQSGGNGLTALFGGEAWSDIAGTSTKYDFNITTPITNAGTLYCCNGSGDLEGGNSYISNVSMMLAYADVTFTYTGSGGAAMDGSHTVRFIFSEDADDSISGEQRGDLLYYDTGASAFRWVDSTDGSLDATRPASPVQMNSAVTAWTNDSGYGNDSIPVIYTEALPESGTDPIVVTEDEMRSEATYSFVFPTEKLVVFPALQAATDAGTVVDEKTLLQYIHLRGLPHTVTEHGIGSTVLAITRP